MISQDLRIRNLQPKDAPDIYRIAAIHKNLDLNSYYYYRLWCEYFGKTSFIAHEGSLPVGFVTAFIKPDDPQTIFAWQSAVDPENNLPDLTYLIFIRLIESGKAKGCDTLEMSTTASNRGISILLHRLAREYNSKLGSSLLFSSAELEEGHEDEYSKKLFFSN